MTDTEKLVEERQRLASALIDEREDHAKRYSEAMEMVNHYDLKADAATLALTAAQAERDEALSIANDAGAVLERQEANRTRLKTELTAAQQEIAGLREACQEADNALADLLLLFGHITADAAAPALDRAFAARLHLQALEPSGETR